MKNIGKKALIIGTVITSVVYIIWRVFYTLPFEYGIIPVIFGILLLLAEIIGFLEAANIYKGSTRLYEPEKPSIPDETFPDIDVFIATYNEPEELLRKSINGCLNMDYPEKSKVHIFVCDDGSREQIRLLADRMKVGYLERDEHNHAKAGNYNHALSRTSSPLVATLDADMIPTHDFLMELVPYFFLPEYEKDRYGNWNRKETDENLKIGFIQSPQSFYNADLFQYNLYAEDKVPNEQNFFFRHVQLARNSDNSAIYCGSNTIISRQALEEAGGFYTESITEDLATGLLIQSKGYKGFAVGSVHANGLSPTELSSLFKQRDRWARGCIQAVRRLHLFSIKGLTVQQKTSYLFTLLYWYTPFRRCMFIMAPILFSVFGIPVMNGTMKEVLIFGVPQLLLYNKTLSGLTGKVRTARLSNIYDTIFINILPGIFMETIGISKNSFSVTNKVKNADPDRGERNFALKSALLPATLLVLSFVGIIRSVSWMAADRSFGYSVILFWLLINSYNILMSLFFILGRKSLRSTDRFAIREKLKIVFEDKEIEAESINLSEGGTAFELDFPHYIPHDRSIAIEIISEDNRYHLHAKANLVHIRESEEGWRYSVRFVDMEEENLLQLYGLLYDREIPMTVHISRKSNFYKDMKEIIVGRIKKSRYSNRMLPRISLNILLESRECREVSVINFNYEYVSVEADAEYDRLHIFADESRRIILNCRKAEWMVPGKGKTALYRIENYEELTYNRCFLRILKSWIDGGEPGRKDFEPEEDNIVFD